MVMTMMPLVVMMAILPMPMMMKKEDPGNDEDNDDYDGNDGDDDVGGDGGCVKTPTAPDFDLRRASILAFQPSSPVLQSSPLSLLPSQMT